MSVIVTILFVLLVGGVIDYIASVSFIGKLIGWAVLISVLILVVSKLSSND